ncbi:hypothetical protein FQA39_LY12494 [Lamprigera yunnana]|nr:hypothetical protein FQA39_LY12494 [Lamprigera yunnana]
MSWLKFNESLSSIKGQITNFASGVLAEDTVSDEGDELRPKEELLDGASVGAIRKTTAYNENWIWETPAVSSRQKNNIVHDLQSKVDILENEKKDLWNRLELLDYDHQQTTDKLIALKDNIQRDYNELLNDYEKLKSEYGDVLKENMDKNKEIERLHGFQSNEESQKLYEHNQEESEENRLKVVQKLKEANRENVELKEAQQKLQHSCELLEKTVKLLEGDVNILKLECDSAKGEKVDLENRCEDLSACCEKIRAQLETESKRIERLNGDKAQLIIDKDLMQNTIMSLQNEKDQLSSIMKQFQSENNSLQEQLKNVERRLKNQLEISNNLCNSNFGQQLQDLSHENLELNRQQTEFQIHFEDKLQNLEKQNTKILEEKQELHEKYVNIITESIEKHMDLDTSAPSVTSEEQPQILEFANKVETLLNLLLDFKTKSETLENQMCEITREKNDIVAEKNFEIEKLLQNSEILSQEVIAKTHAIKDYEDECAELMKNNDLLILELQNFKKNALQTISESNEDNLLLMESQLENANKKIQDMEMIITDLESSNQETSDDIQTELDYIKRQLNMTGQELSKSKIDNQQLTVLHAKLEDEKNLLRTTLEKVRADYENIEYRYTEVNVVMDTLWEENEEYKRKIAILDAKCKKFEDLNLSLQDKIKLLKSVTEEQKRNLDVLEEQINQKNIQIHSDIERLQHSKISETALKLQVDTINKELQNVEMNCNILKMENDSRRQVLEKSDLEKQALQEECENLKVTCSQLTEVNLKLEAEIAKLSESKNELITYLTAKHEENVKYHEEIQRLSNLEAETVKAEELSKKNEEIESITDQNKFLREKCEKLAQNLVEEQSKVQKILSEQSTFSEKEQTLSKELERLRAHLFEVEEMYTQELVQAEQRNKEMQIKVNEIEQREKNSSSIYTSVSIRANQQVETLQTQLQLVSNQRDELRNKISDIEDDNNKHIAAITNLQLVLEQFQKDKGNHVQLETERIRRQINQEKKIQEELRNDNNNLKAQLEESKQGLQAASRLTEQLEKSKRQSLNLKDEVMKLQEKLQKTEAGYRELSNQSDGKVDKTLIKNLIVGYISSNVVDQKQVLKIIATVLDFNKKESDKVSLNQPQSSSWLSSILHPQGMSNSMSHESLSAAFVRFLENESKPKVLPNLLMSKQRRVSEDVSSTSSTPHRQSPLVLSEVVLPTFVDFGKNRNSSSILKDVLKDNT